MSYPETTEKNEIIAKAEDTHHDVGIVGLWFGLNYGSILTYYALYDVVKSMGYSAMMVNKPEVLWRPKYADRETVANKFIYKYCDNNVTQCYHSSMDYKVLNKNCDTFIVGSDVVWHYQICGREAGQFFFLDFVNDDKKKIAMASSFGAGYDAPEEDRMWSEYFMKKFDYIGVREDEAVAICRDTFHCDADKIMDPVFLCKRQVYHDLAANSEVNEDKKYISSYFLGPGEEKARLFLKIAEILGCEYRCLPNPNNPENFTKKTGLPVIQNPSVEDWLKYFQNTQCYVGDSFHGLCFSIIFGRPFVCIVNQGQSLARFRTLLATIGQEHRLINLDTDDTSPEVIEKRIRDILAEEIDYDKVWKIIDEKADESYQWLKNAISSKKKASAAKKDHKTVRTKKMGDTDPDTVAGVPEDVCTGCSACMNVCPVNAISMLPNADGFIMPQVNPEKCVNCHKCIKTCPAVNTSVDNALQPEIYSAMAQNEIREQSSSGGMFTAAAEKILELGGYVCGAAFDSENLQVVHKIVDNKDDLADLRKAKYTQSNINLLYRDIKKLLNKEKIVLFTGTPCQVAGLKAYLGKDYDNLYTIDILCHGVPSQKLLQKYIEEISQKPEISLDSDVPPKASNIIFRDKQRHGWRSSTFIRIEFDNGTVYESSLNDNDMFEHAFHDKIALRKSCADCMFCAFPRQGDISIGDFWGIQQIEPGMTDKLGTSIVFINNSQGKQFFESIKRRLAKRKLMKIAAKDIKKNRVRALYPASPNRTRFMNLLKSHTLEDSVRMINKRQFDVGLCVNFYAVNFGGAMTHYALYHVLEDMGYSTLMIERPKTAKLIDRVTESYKNIHLAPLYPAYAVAPTYKDRDDMRANLNNKCDMFVVGSDKLFNYILYMGLDKYTSLDWVEDSKKKIAYSASFGRTLGNPKIHSELAFYLQRFDHFSCREDSGVVTAEETYGVKHPEWVLDPVFLCDMKHYKTLIDRCTRQTPEKYVSSYILDPTEEKADIVRHFRDQIGGEAEVFSEYQREDSYYKPLGDLYKSPLKTEERLQSIANCDFFVTDSFHGMCFAILMKKPFVAIVNERRGAARFYSIAKMLHLEDRLLNDISELTDDRFTAPIDYDAVYKTLDIERERCMKWLKNALAAPKLAAMTEYDIMRNLIAEQEKKINSLKDLILNMTANISDDISQKTDIIDYLDALKDNTAGNLVVISVKDTPGLALNSFVAAALKSLGLKTNLEGQHGHSYIAVLNGGKVIFEQLGQDSEPVIYDAKFGKHTIHAESRIYTNGNLSSININGKEYSVNSRGLNIVVYQKSTQTALDSVCFDTHISDFTCSR